MGNLIGIPLVDIYDWYILVLYQRVLTDFHHTAALFSYCQDDLNTTIYNTTI